MDEMRGRALRGVAGSDWTGGEGLSFTGVVGRVEVVIVED